MLRDYQKLAVKLMKKKKKSILTNNCNAGKTITCLSLAKELNLPTLVVATNSKVIDWKKEGGLIDYKDYTVVNYNNVHHFTDNLGYFKVILIDECQNMGGFKTLKGRAIIKLCKKADYVVFISATPVKNSPVNVYWPLRLCGVYHGTYVDFRITYCGAYRMIGRNFYIDGRHPTNIGGLKKLIAKAEVYTSHKFRSLKVKKHYINVDLYINKFVKTPDRVKLNTPSFDETSKVRSILADKKLSIFKHYMGKKGLVKKAVFFTHHRKLTTKLAEILKCDMVIGGMDKIKRDKAITRFSGLKEGYIVISLKSGSEGVNIFNCDTCYFLELDFSPAVYHQAYQRIAREFEDKTIKAYFFRVLNEHAFLVEETKKGLFNSLEK